MKYPDDFINKIILGDCIEIMRSIPNKSVDLTLTDPPYNSRSIGPNQRVYSFWQMQLPKKEYKKFCRDWFREALRISKALVFTPGISNTHNYPQPFWQIAWHKPAAVSFNRMGGFNAWEPIFTYGEVTKAKIGQDYKRQDTMNLTPGIEKDHPCPKPLPLWSWLIEHFSKPDDIIFDPFIGAGTTARAAKNLGRQFIGIDINPQYVEITEKRLRQEVLPITTRISVKKF